MPSLILLFAAVGQLGLIFYISLSMESAVYAAARELADVDDETNSVLIYCG